MLQLQSIREIFNQLLYDVKFPSFKVWTLSIDAIWAFSARYEYHLSKLRQSIFISSCKLDSRFWLEQFRQYQRGRSALTSCRGSRCKLDQLKNMGKDYLKLLLAKGIG